MADEQKIYFSARRSSWGSVRQPETAVWVNFTSERHTRRGRTASTTKVPSEEFNFGIKEKSGNRFSLLSLSVSQSRALTHESPQFSSQFGTPELRSATTMRQRSTGRCFPITVSLSPVKRKIRPHRQREGEGSGFTLEMPQNTRRSLSYTSSHTHAHVRVNSSSGY